MDAVTTQMNHLTVAPDFIYIQVEDEIFKIPHDFFEQFRDGLGPPEGTGNGLSTASPLVFSLRHSGTRVQFKAVLHIMFAHSRSQDLSMIPAQLWPDVLKLATMWDFEWLRSRAIHYLTVDRAVSPLEKLMLGVTYASRNLIESGCLYFLTVDEIHARDIAGMTDEIIDALRNMRNRMHLAQNPEGFNIITAILEEPVFRDLF